MGTSKSIPTPKGGAWTPVKTDVTSFLGGSDVSADQILGGTIAAGGIAAPTAFPSRAPLAGAGGGGGGGGERGASARGRGRNSGVTSSGRASVGRAAARLGSFGATVSARGLDAALDTLGLAELRGRPAAEVVARITEHLTAGVDGIQGETLQAALRETIFETSALAIDPTYESLDVGLQDFLSREGVEGLVESFLTHYVFDRVWVLLESHVDRRAETNSEAEALASAIQSACRSHVSELIQEHQDSGNFEALDWFGSDGQKLGQEIVSNLESRLMALR